MVDEVVKEVERDSSLLDELFIYLYWSICFFFFGFIIIIIYVFNVHIYSIHFLNYISSHNGHNCLW